MSQVYPSANEALAATDDFYENREGFGYSPEYVVGWLERFTRLPENGRFLDLCCGDGIWAHGASELRPRLSVFGFDISSGAINAARQGGGDPRFLVADAERELPFGDGSFDVVFARGPGLYNQHSMDRPETIAVIEMWHRKLASNGRMYSIYASTPELMGSYTPPDQVKLPYNKAPRKTATVDFEGGKYHHSIESFLTPFWKANNVVVAEYSFVKNTHILVTKKAS